MNVQLLNRDYKNLGLVMSSSLAQPVQMACPMANRRAQRSSLLSSLGLLATCGLMGLGVGCAATAPEVGSFGTSRANMTDDKEADGVTDVTKEADAASDEVKAKQAEVWKALAADNEDSEIQFLRGTVPMISIRTEKSESGFRATATLLDRKHELVVDVITQDDGSWLLVTERGKVVLKEPGSRGLFRVAMGYAVSRASMGGAKDATATTDVDKAAAAAASGKEGDSPHTESISASCGLPEYDGDWTCTNAPDTVTVPIIGTVLADWTDCCLKHDADYWCGKDASLSYYDSNANVRRAYADGELGTCVMAEGGSLILGAIYASVTELFGGPHFTWDADSVADSCLCGGSKVVPLKGEACQVNNCSSSGSARYRRSAWVEGCTSVTTYSTAPGTVACLDNGIPGTANATIRTETWTRTRTADACPMGTSSWSSPVSGTIQPCSGSMPTPGSACTYTSQGLCNTLGPLVCTASPGGTGFWSNFACPSGKHCWSGSCVEDTTTPPTVGSCFVAGTPIRMADGTTKSIDKIVVGDMVLSADPDTGAILPQRVTYTHLHENPAEPLVSINGTLFATANHRFYTNGGWTRAEHLSASSTLTDPFGHASPVRSLTMLSERPTVVYNLSVDNFHTYFAGGYLVHNAAPGVGGSSDPVEIDDGPAEAR